MPSKNNKILEFRQYRKSDKTPFIVYANLESLVENTDGCKNKSVNIFHQVVQHLKYHHLKIQKISMMYIEVKVA